jgi:hypothetical protein
VQHRLIDAGSVLLMLRVCMTCTLCCVAANLDLYGETGRMLHSSTLGRLHCIPCIMADLHSLHWTGKLYVVHDSMRISSQQIAFFSKWIRRLSNFAPFRIQ